MIEALIWWLLLSLTGLLALPIALRLLRFLPERGFGYSRHIGLLLAGYAFWLLCSLGILENTRISIIAVLLGLGLVSFAVWRRHHNEMSATLRRIAPGLIAGELLFAAAFFGFCLFRAYTPEIAATEKPMEFGFINAILRSRTFPPNDPWLAGYAISYYYFGYVLIAMLAKLSAIPSSVAFNLWLASAFALGVAGAFSLVLNLVLAARTRADHQPEGAAQRRGWRAAILHGLNGSLLTVLIGNLVGVFEFIRARGWGSDALWRFLDIRNLQTTPPSRTWYPDDGWWWWRATRLLHDRGPTGADQEVISEFPAFSFILGDNHPHVLALPFVLLAAALALNILLGWFAYRRAEAPTAAPRPGVAGYLQRLWPGGAADLLPYGLILGALIFLNTWDYPIYLALFLLAYLIGRLGAAQAPLARWVSLAAQSGALLIGLGICFYLPFLLSFRSQAGGVALVTVKTQWQQFALMFGVFLAVAAISLANGVWQALRIRQIDSGLAPWAKWVGAATLLLVFICLLLGWWVAGFALLCAGAAAVLLLNWRAPDGPAAPDAARLLMLMLLLLGFGLIVVIELIYLRDIFGTRMNTVFKFYYQAWVLLALVSAYGIYALVERFKRSRLLGKLMRGVLLLGIALLIAGGLLYTLMAVFSRSNGFSGQPTLDGIRYLAAQAPDDYAAINWLQQNAPPGAVLVEAPGGQYTDYNRLSAYSGVPALLGWGGHELQWRGSYDIPGTREPDIAAIYTSTDLAQTRALLEKYHVTYVVLSPRERDKYELGAIAEFKFDQLLTRVFEQGSLIIYGWPE